jgi:hypothetical protein
MSIYSIPAAKFRSWDIQRNWKICAIPAPSCLYGISTSGEYTAHTEKHQPNKLDCQNNPMIIADLLSATI